MSLFTQVLFVGDMVLLFPEGRSGGGDGVGPPLYIPHDLCWGKGPSGGEHLTSAPHCIFPLLLLSVMMGIRLNSWQVETGDWVGGNIICASLISHTFIIPLTPPPLAGYSLFVVCCCGGWWIPWWPHPHLFLLSVYLGGTRWWVMCFDAVLYYCWLLFIIPHCWPCMFVVIYLYCYSHLLCPRSPSHSTSTHLLFVVIYTTPFP